MSNGAGYSDFTGAMQAAHDARNAAGINKDAVKSLNEMGLAVMRLASATRALSDRTHERIERLHQKIDRMEKQLGSVR
jgi:hypothetical protein